jgi:hypothetical protein
MDDMTAIRKIRKEARNCRWRKTKTGQFRKKKVMH